MRVSCTFGQKGWDRVYRKGWGQDLLPLHIIIHWRVVHQGAVGLFTEIGVCSCDWYEPWESQYQEKSWLLNGNFYNLCFLNPNLHISSKNRFCFILSFVFCQIIFFFLFNPSSIFIFFCKCLRGLRSRLEVNRGRHFHYCKKTFPT